jgi:hypothetical protein
VDLGEEGPRRLALRLPNRFAAREARDRLRVLFLGDSYTEGSERPAQLPEVAARRLAERIGSPVEAINAVGGYGPLDAGNLLEHLVAEGYDFDAVVYGLFLENDFTDNLPATERRVVAGSTSASRARGFLRASTP